MDRRIEDVLSQPHPVYCSETAVAHAGGWGKSSGEWIQNAVRRLDRASWNMDWSHPTFGQHEDTDREASVSTRSATDSPPEVFRNLASEIAFCASIATTQLLIEYLISGFAMELPRLLVANAGSGPRSTGVYWPAILLTLFSSTTILVFARLSDMYTGRPIFVAGLIWLIIWTLVPTLDISVVWLDVSRAMQGLAIAAVTPSTFEMVGCFYTGGPRRNLVLGIYSACAPLGFFVGICVASTLPNDRLSWYFGIAAALALVTLVTALLSIPSNYSNDRELKQLHMDWIGALTLTSGLILVSYALSVQSYTANHHPPHGESTQKLGWGSLSSGIACLGFAFWHEGWHAEFPIIPFDFFKAKNMKAFSLACLCFYGSYGVWLYGSTQYFQSSISHFQDSGIPVLSLWYMPTVIGGVIVCVGSAMLIQSIPIMALLMVSGIAWVVAPLLLAVAPLPLPYWSFVIPSMVCACLGIDITFTTSLIFITSVQPSRYQGLAGAICSSFVDLGMSFSLSIAELVVKATNHTHAGPASPGAWQFRTKFFYATASAAVGLVICVGFIRIPRKL